MYVYVYSWPRSLPNKFGHQCVMLIVFEDTYVETWGSTHIHFTLCYMCMYLGQFEVESNCLSLSQLVIEFF